VQTIHFNSNLIASNYHANNTFIVSCAVNFMSSRSTFLSYFFLLFSPLSLIFSSPLLLFTQSFLHPYFLLPPLLPLTSPLPPLLLTPFYLLSSHCLLSLPSLTRRFSRNALNHLQTGRTGMGRGRDSGPCPTPSCW
jgi:hypothetical protein